MNKSVVTAAVVAAVVLLSLSTAHGQAASKSNPNAAVQRGKYLVSILGCNDCHTPWKIGPKGPEPDMARMLSGHPESLKMPPPPKPAGPWTSSIAGTFTVFAGPWGISYVPNITPDQNTGIGIWTQDLFVKAIQTGKHFGTSREILPPMPWPSYRNMPENDLEAIFAYLRSIPPIVNPRARLRAGTAAPAGPRKNAGDEVAAHVRIPRLIAGSRDLRSRRSGSPG